MAALSPAELSRLRVDEDVVVWLSGASVTVDSLCSSADDETVDMGERCEYSETSGVVLPLSDDVDVWIV